jgi:hypothetical protein
LSIRRDDNAQRRDAQEMARHLRVEFEEAFYHLCARGNARQAIFRDG